MEDPGIAGTKSMRESELSPFEIFKPVVMDLSFIHLNIGIKDRQCR
jgi:hypothetical protein